MRIISGQFKSRKIDTVTSNLTRPTMDKVREAIFNIIGPYFDGGIALDLFAGTGSMGLEAISRGIDFCYFVDINIEPIKVINKNIESLNIKEQASVLKMDYLKALSFLKKKNVSFDLVFLDPPYKDNIIDEIIDFLYQNDMMNDNSLIIAEYDKKITLKTSLPIKKDNVYQIRKVTVFEGRRYHA